MYVSLLERSDWKTSVSLLKAQLAAERSSAAILNEALLREKAVRFFFQLLFVLRVCYQALELMIQEAKATAPSPLPCLSAPDFDLEKIHHSHESLHLISDSALTRLLLAVCLLCFFLFLAAIFWCMHYKTVSQQIETSLVDARLQFAKLKQDLEECEMRLRFSEELAKRSELTIEQISISNFYRAQSFCDELHQRLSAQTARLRLLHDSVLDTDKRDQSAISSPTHDSVLDTDKRDQSAISSPTNLSVATTASPAHEVDLHQKCLSPSEIDTTVDSSTSGSPTRFCFETDFDTR